MKILYTILFFADAILLVALSFLLLKMIDHGIHTAKLIVMLLSLLASIGCLILFLRSYFKISSRQGDKHL